MAWPWGGGGIAMSTGSPAGDTLGAGATSLDADAGLAGPSIAVQ